MRPCAALTMVDTFPATPVSVEPSIPEGGGERALGLGSGWGVGRGGGKPRVALVHDWLCGYRGGEAVLERIAGLVIAHGEPAGLWVMVSDGKGVAPGIDSLDVRTSVLQEIPGGSGKLRRHLLPLYPRAVEDISEQIAAEHRRRAIDLVISTSSAAVKGVRAPAGAGHICYCHTPARYLWSQTAEYGSKSWIARIGLGVCGSALRAWDRGTAANVTVFLANSRHTAGEIERCYGRASSVVFPPVRTEFFTPDASVQREDFWLVAGALEPYKQTDLAILAAQRAGAEIVIAGMGSQLATLKRRFGGIPRVRFAGRTSDQELRDLYRRARVLVFPQVEDFGIVAVEAQACGLAVAARRAGGALDTVIEGWTGAFFDEGSPEGIVEAVGRLPAGVDAASRANALRFSEGRFDAEIEGVIRNTLGIKRVG